MAQSQLLEFMALQNTNMYKEPYRWGIINQTFASLDIARILRDEFPMRGYQHYSRNSSDKQYSIHGYTVVKQSQRTDSINEYLSPLWSQVIDEILSSRYRESIAEGTSISLDDLQIEATFWRNPTGSHLAAHQDNPDKVLTHIIYFCEDGWLSSSGGCLRILRSPDIDDVFFEHPPLINTSMLIARSDTSWHGYTRIEPPNLDRLTFQIIFYRPGLKYSM